MSKVLITADLHFDIWDDAGLSPLDRYDLAGVERLIIAGDLTNKPPLRWKEAFTLLSERIALDRVHVIPGNHDCDGFRLDLDDQLSTRILFGYPRLVPLDGRTCADERGRHAHSRDR